MTKLVQPEQKWIDAAAKAAKSNKWAITMTKVLIARNKGRTPWRLVTFRGPKGGESVGIVDILAVRKNHAIPKPGFKKGDLFEVILIQVKGGSAAWPSTEDIERLQAVARFYKAKAVLLAEWKKGAMPRIYRLGKRLPHNLHPHHAWTEVDSLQQCFK